MARTKRKKQAGFTLIEMLIVVLLLGILAMLIIPQISVSTDDAMLNTLQGTYPGANDINGAATADPAQAATAFVQQLTQYTDINGDVSPTKDATHIYGPYLKSLTLPTNPYNNNSNVLCDTTENDITVRADGVSLVEGWKFYTQTGALIANDGNHDTL